MKHSETDANSFKNKWVYTHLPSIRDVSFLKIQWARTSFQALTGFVVPLHNMTLIRNNFYSTVTMEYQKFKKKYLYKEVILKPRII